MNISEILRDFRTKYQGTFVFTENPETGREILCRLDEIAESSERNAVLYLSSKEAGKLQLNLASSQRLLFRYPQVGTFQMGKDAVVCRRKVPHRSYTRGLYSNNHMFNYAVSSILGTTNSVRFDLNTVSAAFEAQKYPLDEAIKLLVSMKVRSVALKGMWSLCQPVSEGGTEFLLLYGFDFVGTLDKDLVFKPARGMEVLLPEVSRLLMGL